MTVTILLALSLQRSRLPNLDTLEFGNAKPEAAHALVALRSDTIQSGLGLAARRLLPLEHETWEGGRVGFEMKVDPRPQDYFTIKL